MGLKGLLTVTKLPYILLTLFLVSLFLIFCPPSGLNPFIPGLIFFLIILPVAIIRDYHYRRRMLSSADRRKIKEYIRQGLSLERHNLGLQGALETSKELFDVAENEIIIQAGNLTHEFYENSVISNALEEFLKNGHKIRMICSPKDKCDPLTRTIFSFLNNRQYDIKIVYDKERPEIHFIVVDNKHYRLEKKHPPEVHFEANIFYNNSFAADFHRFLFLKKWQGLAENAPV